MTLQRVKEALPGVTGLASHRIVYREVGQGLTRNRSLQPCAVMAVFLTALVAYVFKNF